MRESEYVHLATHGTPDGVVLSGKTEEEMMLSMAEVQALELPALKLVVLSTCDSFKGKLHSDGVVGIARDQQHLRHDPRHWKHVAADQEVLACGLLLLSFFVAFGQTWLRRPTVA